jgi:hypothetical protein
MLVLTVQLKLSSEALPKRSANNQSHIIISVLKQYRHVFSNLEFVVLTVASSFVYMSVYIYLSQIPFLLAKLHYSTKDFSLFFIPISIAFIIGGFLSKQLLKAQVSFIKIFLIVNIIFVISLIIVIVTKLTNINLSGWLLMTPFFIFTIGAGMAMPNIVSEALHKHPLRRGTAASAIGLTQNLTAFIFTGIGAHLTYYGYNGLIVTYVILVILPIICFFIYSLIKK